jgi:hypothetical protein
MGCVTYDTQMMLPIFTYTPPTVYTVCSHLMFRTHCGYVVTIAYSTLGASGILSQRPKLTEHGYNELTVGEISAMSGMWRNLCNVQDVAKSLQCPGCG